MMIRQAALGAGLCAALGLVGPYGARAAGTGDPWTPQRWYVHLGPAGLLFDASATVGLAGQRVPGGNATVANNSGLEVEAGYYITPNIAVSITGGLPLTTKATGRGALSAAGELGKITYGPGVVQLSYHFQQFGRFKPYLGVGVNYTTVFNSDDVALRNVSASDTFGPVITAGFDCAITRHLGLYFDIKKLWTYTDVKFNHPAGAALIPGTARVHLDPLVPSAGLTVRF